jgi:hypothetical protein
MKAKWNGATGGVLAVVILCLLGGCGGGNSVNQRDGAELTALMTQAQEAYASGDAESFVALFGEAGAESGQHSWRHLQEADRGLNEYMVRNILSPPELARANNRVHVAGLKIHVWFDYSTPRQYAIQAHRTTWSFQRAETNGKLWLADITIDLDGEGYEFLATDLNLMPEHDLMALQMEWADTPGPDPVVAKTLQVLQDGDLERMKDYTLDGVMFHALDKGIGLQVVENSRTGLGAENRANATRYWRELYSNAVQCRTKLRAEPTDLTPLYNAYNVVSVPEKCTMLGLDISVAEIGLPEQVESMTLSWTAGYFDDKWLVNTLGVSEATTIEYQFTYASE